MCQSGDANKNTRDYLNSILIEQRLINTDIATTDFELFGESFSTPIMMPAFSHLGSFGEGRPSGLVEYSIAAKNFNAVNWVGMMENDQFSDIISTGAKTIRIIKPYADRNKILDQMIFAQENNALAVGIDIDHSIGSNGGYDIVVGEDMTVIHGKDLREFTNVTRLPFVVKGVLSVRDAAHCAEAGVNAIVVSHHHGRLPFAIAPLMVLPEIRKELANTGIKIFVDCHMDSGFDAFKAIALGADAVSVGRAMLPRLQEQGVDGVTHCLKRMTEELAMTMAYTNFRKLEEIDPSVLWNLNTGKHLI